MQAGQIGLVPRWHDALQQAQRGLPTGWKAHRIPAGLWLSSGHGTASQAVAAARLAPDPERPALVLDVPADSPAAALGIACIARLLPTVDGVRPVRLLLPRGEPAALELPLIEGKLDAVVGIGAPTGVPGRPVALWATGAEGIGGWVPWTRIRPEHPAEPLGLLYPSPVWERTLLASGVPAPLPGTATTRVPAGLLLTRVHGTGEVRSGALSAALVGLPAEAERMALIVDAEQYDHLLLAAIDRVLGNLDRAAVKVVRVVWPNAGTGRTGSALAELAAWHRVSLLAPDGRLLPIATPGGPPTLAVARSAFDESALMQRGAGHPAPDQRFERTPLLLPGGWRCPVIAGRGTVSGPTASTASGPLLPAPPWEGAVRHSVAEAAAAGLTVRRALYGIDVAGPDGVFRSPTPALPDPLRPILSWGGNGVWEGGGEIGLTSVVRSLRRGGVRSIRLLVRTGTVNWLPHGGELANAAGVEVVLEQQQGAQERPKVALISPVVARRVLRSPTPAPANEPAAAPELVPVTAVAT
ncbi:hypothetical protein ACWGI8_41080, partial [Streptomyces sp. NPDC054841]